MKEGITLQALAAEVERVRDSKADYVADTRELTFSGGRLEMGSLARGGLQSFGLTDHAHAQIAARLQIPKAYYDRMRKDASELLDSNVNHWFVSNPERRMIRTLDGDVRAFLSDRYRIRDNDELMEAIFPVLMDLGEEVRFVSTSITPTKLYIKALFPKIQGEVEVGDPVQYGLLISNSEVGNGSLTTAPFTYRLICKNGMTHISFGERTYHIGKRAEADEETYRVFSDETLKLDDQAYWAKVADAVRAAADEATFQSILNGYKEAAGQEIEIAPPKAVERIVKRYSLTQEEGESVLTNLTRGGDLSKWGLANAVTAVANSADDYDRASEFERLGGQIVEMEDKDWAAVAA